MDKDSDRRDGGSRRPGAPMYFGIPSEWTPDPTLSQTTPSKGDDCGTTPVDRRDSSPGTRPRTGLLGCRRGAPSDGDWK